MKDVWNGRPRHQFIDVGSHRCGSICDNNTLKNTIHLKVKYDEFNERSISCMPCMEHIQYEFLTTCGH